MTSTRTSARTAAPVGTSPADDAPVLRVASLTKQYPLPGGWFGRGGGRVLKALDGVDLDLRRGEVLGLVGESGSGKSTLAKIVVGSTPPTTGEVAHEGGPVGGTGKMWEYRWTDGRDGNSVQGPYDGPTMKAWQDAGYFEGVEFRAVGEDTWDRLAEFV